MKPTACLSIIGAILSLLWVPSANAIDSACDGCSYSQMRSKALTLGKGEHRIYSLSTGYIYGFSVICPGDVPLGAGEESRSQNSAHQIQQNPISEELPENTFDGTSAVNSCPSAGPLKIYDAPISGSVLSAWTLAHSFYQKNGRIDRVDVNFNVGDTPGRYGDSVYNALSDAQARNDLYEWIFDRSQGITDYVTALAAGLVASFNILPNQLLVGVVFKDGSSIVLRYDAALRQLSIVPNSARLSNGQIVVEHNSADFQGNYNMGGVDQDAYIDYLRSMGVTVVNGGLSGRLICSFDGVKLTCRVSHLAN